jgi:uncharacterized membrane protein YheB (UPF0754 family)
MIKFDELSEKTENSSEVANGYLNIKPVEQMSDREVSDFIAKEFAKAHDEAEIDTAGKLLSEVFNRSEEELNIDFNISDRVKSVLEKFKSEEWETLDTKKQMSAVKDLAKAIGKELQIDKLPKVELRSEDETYGAFDATMNKIALNAKYLDDPVEVVNTVAHELRHAYQHMRAEILETREDALYKLNFENYISPRALPGGGYVFFTDYLGQYVEVDARAFANQLTEAMR